MQLLSLIKPKKAKNKVIPSEIIVIKASSSYVTRKIRVLTLLGSVMLIMGVSLYVTFPPFISNSIRSQLTIQEGNQFTKSWSQIPYPAELKVYLFSIENPIEFEDGAKAKLKEMGPYSYDLYLYNEIISYNADQTKVKYWEYQSFDVRPETAKKLQEKVKVLNFPVYAMANMIRNLVDSMPFSVVISPVIMGFVNILFMTHEESLIKEVSVGELLNGYRFRILETIDTLGRPLSWFGITLPDTGMPENKFGFLWTKNFSRGGPLEAYTGQKGTEALNVVKFKDQESLQFYDEPECNSIQGTEGTIFGTDVQRDKLYYVFKADTCKVYNMKYQKDTWVNGIPTYRFTPNPNLFRSPSRNPLNRCYCTTPDNEDMCDGVFDLSRCVGAPVAYSWPHFYDSSLVLRNNVKGMRPVQEKHQAFLDIEPFMGSALQGYEKLQTNALIKPISYLARFRNFPESILPMLWVQKGAVINDELTWQLRTALYPLYGIFFLIYFLMFGGAMILVGVAANLWRKSTQVDDQLKAAQQLISQESQTQVQLQPEAAAVQQNIRIPSAPPAPVVEVDEGEEEKEIAKIVNE